MEKRAKLRKGSKVFFSSQAMTEEMGFQVSLENCQGFSIPDEGGKSIPTARNGESKRVCDCTSIIIILSDF